MSYLYLVGRVLFALIFITAAPRHFTHEGIQHAADLGVPFAALLVPVSGLMAIAGGLSVAAGYNSTHHLGPNTLCNLEGDEDERATKLGGSTRILFGIQPHACT